jgi:hypothetical protein
VPLLPADALRDVHVGVSASVSPDLPRLGLLEDHFRLALGEIVRLVLVSSGRLVYGGHLKPTGYTAMMIDELHKYARRDHPLTVCLAWSVHRQMSLRALHDAESELGLYGRIVCLDIDGNEIQPERDRGDVPDPPLSGGDEQRSLTNLRRYLTAHVDGRILIGGKRNDFGGRVPGLMEEALFALQAEQPLFLAGGFGGVTHEIVRALGIDDGSWLPAVADALPDDERLVQGRNELEAFRQGATWAGLRNGLSVEENRQLAASHRSSEIVALVGTGLGRVYGREA